MKPCIRGETTGRTDGRREIGMRKGEDKEECGYDGVGDGGVGEQAEAGTQKGIMSFVK